MLKFVNRFTVSSLIFALGFSIIAYHAEPIPTPEPEPEISTIELSCMVLTIWGEARSESLLGQKLVANVIMNRVKSDRFPDTICEVVHQPYQFSMYNKGDINAEKARRAFAEPNTVETLTAIQAGLWAIEGGSILPSGSLHYHTVKVEPGWGKRLDQYERIGEHLFYAN